jgi:putative transcriptional regulator
MNDPIFGGTVVYICEHNDKGVLGRRHQQADRHDHGGAVRPHRPEGGRRPASPVVDEPIMFGGPVQDDRGFVLHSPGGRYSSSLSVTDDVAFTTSIDVLEAVANGEGRSACWSRSAMPAGARASWKRKSPATAG